MLGVILHSIKLQLDMTDKCVVVCLIYKGIASPKLVGWGIKSPNDPVPGYPVYRKITYHR